MQVFHPQRRALASPEVRNLILLSAILILYANTRAFVSLYFFEVSAETFLTMVSLGMALLVVLWAMKVDGLSLSAIGLTPEGAWEKTVLGFLFGMALVAPALAFLASPPPGMPDITLTAVDDMNRGDLLYQIAFRIPLGTVIIEEVAFRGAIQGNLRRYVSVRSAILLSTLIFAFWHLTVNYHILQLTSVSVGEDVDVVLVLGLFLGVYFGGVVLATLKEVSGHLAAPMAAHWVLNSSMLAILYFNSGLIS